MAKAYRLPYPSLSQGKFMRGSSHQHMACANTGPHRHVWVGGTLLLLLAMYLVSMKQAFAETGKAIFEQRCAQCHTIGGGKLVGPDLKDIGANRKTDWLLQFIQSPQRMIQRGDPTAKSLVAQYGMVMPDQALSSAEVHSILTYISQASEGASPASVPPAAVPSVAEPPSAAQIMAGARLFTGETRLTHGGAACISCHDVNNAAVGIAGGKLAVGLTGVCATLGADGIKAMITTPPFAPMAMAYESHPVTNAEATQLIAFLQAASTSQAAQAATPVSNDMLLAGGAGMLAILAVIHWVWIRRKKFSTKHLIYARQIKTH